MNDKYLYDKNGGYVGKVSDKPPGHNGELLGLLVIVAIIIPLFAPMLAGFIEGRLMRDAQGLAEQGEIYDKVMPGVRAVLWLIAIVSWPVYIGVLAWLNTK